MKIQETAKELEAQGYVLLQQGQDQRGEYFRFINKETFQTICINEESLDDEELWDTLGTNYEELKEAIIKKGETSDEAEAIIDREGKEYSEVIAHFIKSNEEVLK